jgi:hypothetical protein
LPITLVEIHEHALARALKPFAAGVRTVDELHLATMMFIQAPGYSPEFASYDSRLVAGARTLGIAVALL